MSLHSAAAQHFLIGKIESNLSLRTQNPKPLLAFESILRENVHRQRLAFYSPKLSAQPIA
jgi:hypothetical protein